MRVMGDSVRGFAAYFGSLVHESARHDVGAAARQQSFIASHLLGGLLALCVFPIYLVLVGKPSLAGAAAFLWLLSRFAIAIFLSRTGRLTAAHVISAVNVAGLVTFVAWFTGGIQSYLVPWMVVVPLEAALSTDRRVTFGAGGAAALGLLVLAVGGALGYVPPAPLRPVSLALLAFFGALSAAAYAAGLAVSIQLIQKRSEEAGEDRYRLLTENATDLITRQTRGVGSFLLPLPHNPCWARSRTNSAATVFSSACMSPTGQPILRPCHAAKSPTRRSRSSSGCARVPDRGAMFGSRCAAAFCV